MIKLSAVIITYNEQKNIARCIDSVLNVCDDVVVLDSFSTDNTAAICKSYNQVNFVQRQWQGYSATKNFAHTLARHSFILSIDADECLSERLIDSIKQLNPNKGVAYDVNRLNNYCGTWVKHGGWYPDKKIRLFHRENAKWMGDFVHETLHLDDTIHVVHLKGDLLHYAFENKQDHLQKIERYAQLHAKQLKQNGKKFNLARMLFAPIAKFIHNYIIQFGILDGVAGFNIARYSAYAVYKKYQLLK
jgi:glycosyltransferase involved in cell wall biosynthesis